MDPLVFAPRSAPDFQPQRAEPDAFDRDAAAVVRAWALHAYQPERADAALAERLPWTRRRDDRSLLLLSRVCQALTAIVCWPEPLAQASERLAPLQAEAQALGWPRALWLLQAAQAFEVLRAPQQARVAQAIHNLRAHPPALPVGLRPQAGQGGREPIEAFWTEAALCGLHAVQGDLESAVRHGLAADVLATRGSMAVLMDQAALVLSHALVCHGDLDGAAEVLARRAAPGQASLRSGLAQQQLQTALALCQVLAGRVAEARPLCAQWPALRWPAVQSQGPGLRFLAAVLALDAGDAAGAERLLGDEAPDAGADGWCMPANRAWLRGRIALALGQPEVARQACEQHLQRVANTGLPLPPLHATRLHEVLSAACEALGDLPAALRALKQAHQACALWAGGSVRAHLQWTRHAGVAAPLQHPLQGLQGMAALRALADLEQRHRAFPAPPEG